MPLGVARAAPRQGRADLVVAIAENVGLHLDDIAHQPLHRETAAVDARRHVLYHRALAAIARHLDGHQGDLAGLTDFTGLMGRGFAVETGRLGFTVGGVPPSGTLATVGALVGVLAAFADFATALGGAAFVSWS